MGPHIPGSWRSISFDQSNAYCCAKPTRVLPSHRPLTSTINLDDRTQPITPVQRLHTYATNRTERPSVSAPTCCAHRVLDLSPSSLRTSQGRWWQRWATLHRTARLSATISGAGFRLSATVAYLVLAVDAIHTKSRLLQSLGGRDSLVSRGFW